ncbi:DMT family transporter [Desulfovirgula thermocuniculi]|uniref:DMT family transporter n=1 Tax=Desulfovirgula thermocuniculi TaxID=348842 RepID=UPI0003F58E0E|nr:EamA family transporter [Desulfovirgula thermocuniculi]
MLYFTCETYGVKQTSASESSIIISLVPVAVFLFSGVMLREKINVCQGLCVVASVAGVALMAAAGPGGAVESGGSHLQGVLWLLGAVLAAALYTILSRRAGSHFSAFEVTLVMMWAGALAFGAAGLAEGALTGCAAALVHAWQRPVVLGGLLYLGLIASVAAFFLYNYAVAHMPASRAAVFLNLVPVTSCVAGFLFFGERLGSWQLAGAALILLGVWGTNYFAGRGGRAPVGEEVVYRR